MFKSLVKFLFIVFFGAVTLIAVLPVLLSTQSTQTKFFRLISILTHSEIEAKQINLDWFAGQHIKGFSFKNNFSQLYIDDFSTQNSLIKFLVNGFKFDEVTTKGVQAQLKQKKTGKSSHWFFIPSYKVTLDDATIELQSIEQTTHLSQLYLMVDLRSPMSLLCHGEIKNQSEKGTFDLSLKESSLNGLYNVYLNFKDFPLHSLDHLIVFSGHAPSFKLENLLGKKLNGQIVFFPHEERLDVDLSSDRGYCLINPLDSKKPLDFQFEIEKNTFVWQKDLPIKCKISGKDLKVNFQNLADTEGLFSFLISDLSLDCLSIKHIKGSLWAKNHTPFQITLDAGISSPYFKSDLNTQLKCSPTFDSFELNVIGKNSLLFDPLLNRLASLDVLKFNASCLSLKMNASLSAIASQDFFFGKTLEIAFDSDQMKSLIEIPKSFNIKVDSTGLKSSSLVYYDNGFYLKDPAYFSFQLAPQIIKKITPNLVVKEPISADGHFLRNSSLENLKGEIFFKPLQLVLNSKEIIVKEITSKFESNFIKNDYAFTFFSKIDNGEIKLEYENAGQPKTIKLKGHLNQIPTALYEVAYSRDPLFCALIGKEVSGKVSSIFGQETNQTAIDLKTEQLEIKGTFDLTPKSLFLSKPLLITSWLKAEDLETIFGLNTVVLAPTTNVKLELTELVLPRDTNFLQMKVKGRFNCPKLKFDYLGKESEISNLNFEIKKKIGEPLDAVLSSDLSKLSPRAKLQGYLGLDDIDLSSFKNAIVSLQGKVQLDFAEVPVVLIQALTSPFSSLEIEKVLGHEMNMNLQLDAKKAFKELYLEVQSPYTSFVINGNIVQDKLILKTPIIGKLSFTKSFIADLLQDTDIDFINSRQPASFKISDQGFICPLSNISLESLYIDYFSLDLGQVYVRNRGNLKNLESFFKKRMDSKLQLWFAPIEGSLKGGLLKLDRTEILLDETYPLAFWGKVSFPKHFVDMTIGLTAKSLKTALGISKLPESFVLTVPLNGPFGDVKLQKSDALAKIAILIAHGQKFNGTFGAMADIFNQLMNDQSKIPKAKRPSPWEKPTSFNMEIEKPDQVLLHFKKRKGSSSELINYSLSIDELIPKILEVEQTTEEDESSTP
jgi:hypothetical protein